jgi:hypothetical protein
MLPTRRDCLGLHCLGGLPCLSSELDNLSASPRCTLQWCVEVRRDVKLNHLRHESLLMPANPLWVMFDSLLPQVPSSSAKSLAPASAGKVKKAHLKILGGRVS